MVVKHGISVFIKKQKRGKTIATKNLFRGEKMKKNIIIFGMVLVMLFSVAFLGAGQCIVPPRPSDPCYECEEEPCVCISPQQFPASVKDFVIEDFDADFFEYYTLVMVSFSIGTYMSGVFLYAVYIENGRLNILLEITGLSPDAVVSSAGFVVLIPNETIAKYELGIVRGFHIYDGDNPPLHGGLGPGPNWEWLSHRPVTPADNREWLSDIHLSSVESKAANIIDSNLWHIGASVMTPITSVEELMVTPR